MAPQKGKTEREPSACRPKKRGHNRICRYSGSTKQVKFEIQRVALEGPPGKPMGAPGATGPLDKRDRKEEKRPLEFSAGGGSCRRR